MMRLSRAFWTMLSRRNLAKRSISPTLMAGAVKKGKKQLTPKYD
jgi:hypothetical protein